MARPYSKKTIRDAAFMLDLWTSSTDATLTPLDFAASAGVRKSDTAYRLALEAVDAVGRFYSGAWISRAACALEAAALVREGWRIGDPVPRYPRTEDRAAPLTDEERAEIDRSFSEEEERIRKFREPVTEIIQEPPTPPLTEDEVAFLESENAAWDAADGYSSEGDHLDPEPSEEEQEDFYASYDPIGDEILAEDENVPPEEQAS